MFLDLKELLRGSRIRFKKQGDITLSHLPERGPGVITTLADNPSNLPRHCDFRCTSHIGSRNCLQSFEGLV